MSTIGTLAHPTARHIRVRKRDPDDPRRQYRSDASRGPLDASRDDALPHPIDPSGSLYARWVGHDDIDVDLVAERYRTVPGAGIDWANKLMKPVTNYVTTYRRVFQSILDGHDPRESYQAMANWVADTLRFPPEPTESGSPGCTRRTGWSPVADRLRLRVDLTRIEQNLRVVTAGADHIVPPEGTVPILDLVSSEDVTHFDRPAGHIGLMAGSKAKHEIWSELADWLRDRSDRGEKETACQQPSPRARTRWSAARDCTAASRS